MGWLGAITFASPLALWALLALPVIWWLLRSTPPRPLEQAFPPLRILLKLRNIEDTPDKMPWWLLLLRLTLAATLIFAVAHPFLRHSQSLNGGPGPVLLVLDDGWAAAKQWPQRQETALRLAGEAEGRVVELAGTSLAEPPTSDNATDAAKKLRAWAPKALPTSRKQLLPLLNALTPKPAEIIWLADDIDAGSGQAFAEGLAAIAPAQVIGPPVAKPVLALGTPGLSGADIVVNALRGPQGAGTATLQALSGDGRVLAEAPVNFANTTTLPVHITLPVELRNEIQSLTLAGEGHAGARQLLDDSWRRKTVAIEGGSNQSADQPLLSAQHYLVTALGNEAEISTPQGSEELKAALDAGVSMLVLADAGVLPQAEHDAIAAWLDQGGLLLRFAGPHLAAGADDLVPVKLHEGDRNLGSSLSWETPQAIKPFPDQGALAGIAVDPEAKVSRQLLAEPDAELAQKTWASLEDGTPLITSARHGKGRIILFHVTANAEWSNLPLTGTFAQVMRRILELAPAAGSPKNQGTSQTVEGDFAARLLLNGAGELETPTGQVKTISQRDIASTQASAATPPGFYARGGQNRAINLKLTEKDLLPLPASLGMKPLAPEDVQDFAAPLFTLAALLFLLDGLAAIFVGGHWRKGAAALMLCGAMLLPQPHFDSAHAATAQDEAMQAALQTHLAFIKTGDAEIDQASEQGLTGLGGVVADRTSAELGEPKPIDIENDELVFYPLLYWPVTPDAEAPNPKALERISAYMKNGGTIFFDLRDNSADPNSSPAGDALRRIMAKLDVPPLEPVPESHALTKSFYLLKDFPGRYQGAPLWVEAQDDPQASGFDNVSGIIIGANDYAAAWARNDKGQPLYAVIPGTDRQREFAYRVGINVVMYVLTGNYKTDQVHVPAILERLGKK
ncbi:MAG: DUF4159 domain-containing protein [Alphaproteobacteria bacterium]|nr:DUF4159 domain-containing protein [Alphaproteobacteria bacterium]